MTLFHFIAESLGEPRNWRSATNAVSQVLEEAATSSTNPRSKQMFGNANKQFRFMHEVSERRQEERAKLDLQLTTVTGKLTKEKKEVKALRKKKQMLETQIEKCQDDIVELKKEVVCMLNFPIMNSVSSCKKRILSFKESKQFYFKVDLAVRYIFTQSSPFYAIIYPWFLCNKAKDRFVIALQVKEKRHLSQIILKYQNSGV